MKAPNDVIRLQMIVGPQVLRLDRFDGLDWPPPEFLWLSPEGIKAITEDVARSLPQDERDHVMVQTSRSEISDEDAVQMAHVARAAEYVYWRRTREG